jgi:hypothetical protein
MATRDPNTRYEVRHDLRIAAACEFGDYLPIYKINCVALQPAWYSFQHNIESVKIMAGLPTEVVFAAIDHLLTLSQATFNVLGKPVMVNEELMPNRDAISAEYDSIKNHFFDGRRDVIETFARDLILYNSNTLVNSPLNKPGFFALLEAQVIGVWTAFDVLTSELCVAAVNADPRSLYNFGDQKIELKSLLKASVAGDWSGRMGELLKEFVRLDSYKGKVDAYKQLFQTERIRKAIESPAIRLACLLRSQLVHNSGLADSSFVAQAKKINMEPWNSVQEGQRLPLDGVNVAEVSESLIHSANELIMAVDERLKQRTEKDAKRIDQDQ